MMNMTATVAEREIAINFVNEMMRRGFADVWRESDFRSDVYCWYCEAGFTHDRGYDYASGETKHVFFMEDLERWVIKVASRDSYQRDWCQREFQNYCAAVNEKLGFYFAAMEPLITISGFTFYLQEKVFCDEGVDGELFDTLKEDYESSGTDYDVDSLYNEIDDMDASERVYTLYGNSELAAFISEHRINDLHSGNFGLRDGMYIIVDYSGFGQAAWGPIVEEV